MARAVNRGAPALCIATEKVRWKSAGEVIMKDRKIAVWRVLPRDRQWVPGAMFDVGSGLSPVSCGRASLTAVLTVAAGLSLSACSGLSRLSGVGGTGTGQVVGGLGGAAAGGLLGSRFGRGT